MKMADEFLQVCHQKKKPVTEFMSQAPRNATYLSPQIQNQLIDCLGYVIRENIVQEANKAGFLSIMADKTCDVSTTEQMAVAIRYLRTNDMVLR